LARPTNASSYSGASLRASSKSRNAAPGFLILAFTRDRFKKFTSFNGSNATTRPHSDSDSAARPFTSASSARDRSRPTPISASSLVSCGLLLFCCFVVPSCRSDTTSTGRVIDTRHDMRTTNVGRPFIVKK